MTDTVTIPLRKYEKMKEEAESIACIIFEDHFYKERKIFYNNDNIENINEDLIDIIEKMEKQYQALKKVKKQDEDFFKLEYKRRINLENLSVYEFIKMKFRKNNIKEE